MKKTVVIDDNGQGFEQLEKLLHDHGFSVSAVERENGMRNELKLPDRSGAELFDYAPIGIFRSTLDGKLVNVNPAMARLLKYDSPEEMISVVNRSTMAEAVYVNPARRRELIEHVLRSGGWQVFEEMFRCKDGSVVTCNFHFRAVPGQTGHPGMFEAFLEDVSARKQAEVSLSLNQFIIDNASIGIMRGDHEGRILSVNEYWANVLGYTREELCSMSYFDIDPNLTPEFWRAHREILTSTGFNTFESHHRRKDGTVFPVQVAVNYLSFGGQEFSCSFAMDISARKQAEEAVRAKTEELDRYFTRALDLLCIADTAGYFKRLNKAWETILGYGIAELEQSRFLDYVHPEDMGATLDAIARLEAQREVPNFVNRYRAKDGSYRWIEWRSFPEGGLIYAVARDITDRKRVEETLRLANEVVENSPMVLFRWKAAEGWPVETVSGNVTRFGYAPEELLSGKVPFSSLVHPDDLERVFAELEEFCRCGEDRFQQEYRIVTRKGEVLLVDDRTVVERDAGGRITHFQGVLMDISERKRTENVITARMRLLQFAATHSVEDLLQATLDEAEKLTGSCIGFYHFLEADQKTLSLQNWSTRTKNEFCKAEGSGLHYDVASAGVWVDCIHQRRPVIHNDYASLPHRRGLPPGHAPVVRQLVVPVIRGGSIEAIFGVGNKPHDYTSHDVETVSLLADLAWGIVGLKRAEAALSESERRYRAIIEDAPLGIARADRKGKLLRANPAFAGILKYDSTEELLETVNRSSIHEALFVDPERRETIIEEIFVGNSWHVFENRYRCKDGSVITCRVHSRRVFDPAGKESEFESFLENITERLEAEKALKESEEKFRVLAETSPSAIALYQGEEVIYINSTASRLMGYTVEELSRRSFWGCVHDDFKELVRERGLARMRGEAVPEQYECKFVTKDGRELWVLMAVGRIEYNGRPAGIVTLVDTTQAKLADDRIRASLAEKEVLLKEVHHRVKNNLQIISSLLDLQSDYLRDEKSRAVIKESQSRIRSMALIHQKLYQSESFAFVNFREYIEELAMSLFATYAGEPYPVQLAVDVGEVALGMDEAIPCGLIVNELVSNSLKHAFPDGRKGMLTVSCHAGETGQIELTVADTGVGLPPGFDCGNAETLGLQLVTMLVRQLGGTMTVDGEAGGTAVAIRFAGRRSA
jgi:PAS domain S-box-containing protein